MDNSLNVDEIVKTQILPCNNEFFKFLKCLIMIPKLMVYKINKNSLLIREYF